MAVAVAVAVAVGVEVAVAVAVGVAVAVSVGLACWRRRRRAGWQSEGIHFVIGTEVDAAASSNSGVPLARACHQFVSAAACVNDRACIAIVAVQALVTS